MERNNQQTTVRGIILPVDWDEKVNVTRIAIMTTKEEEYLVEENAGWRKLLTLMQREVEVRGVMREEASQKIIMVEDCEQIR